MDKISSNPALNYAQLYQQTFARKTATTPEQNSVSGAETTDRVRQADQPLLANDFSSMFGDDELAKLQQNLETIANLADKALQSFDA